MNKGLLESISIKTIQYWPKFFLFFIGIGFLLPSLPIWALFFYCIFIPFFLLRLLVKPLRRPSVSIIIVFLLIFWILLSFIWSPSWHGIIDLVCTAIFIGGGILAQQDTPYFQTALKRVCMVGMTLNSAAALCKMIVIKNIGDRPGGVGMFHTTLPAVAVAGICLLWACSSLVKNKQNTFEAWGSIIVLPSFMLLSGSRAPCCAFLLATLFVFISPPRYRFKKIMSVIISGLFLGCLLMWSRVQQCLNQGIERGDSYHRLIWKTVWDASKNSFIIGHGQGASVSVHAAGKMFSHAHNLYLEVLYSNGLVGVFLFALVWLWPLYSYLKLDKISFMAVPFFISLVIMTDIALPFKGPSDVWYVIWLPWLYCLDFKDVQYSCGIKDRL